MPKGVVGKHGGVLRSRYLASATWGRLRRWLSILLLVFLSLQSTWTVAAVYCQHETEASAQHYGHHEHQHPVDDNSQDASGPLSNFDGDCAVCHASGAVALSSYFADAQPVIAEGGDYPRPDLALVSPPNEQPERPNWPVSA